MSSITLPTLKLFINGEWVDSTDGKTFPVVDPQTENVRCNVSQGGKADIDKAVQAAKQALNGEWTSMGPIARRNLLLKLADLLQAEVETISKLESQTNGGPLGLQQAIIQNLPEDIRYYAGWADKIDGRVPPQVAGPGIQISVRREPIGVCGLILPWNVPLWALITKLGPCLAAGNTAVVKPAEQTPLTALRMAELIKQAGFPNGVVNFVPGYGDAGAALSTHMDVDKIAFTGSTDVGRLVLKASADSNLKKVQLELGGKSPLVVFPDADLDTAVEIAGSAIFINNGQLCTAGSRTFVHKDIYDAFVKKSAERAAKITIGDPLTSQQGPLVDKDQFERVIGYIEIGKKEGAKLLSGGARLGQKGYFVQPTVFSDVKDNMTIAREEIFGPVQSILKFDSIKEVIERCNSSQYGLAAGVVTKDIDTMFAFTNNVKAGTVWVNTYAPVFAQAEFGGYKQSGFGREGGSEGINEWSQTKTIMVGVQPKL